MFERYTEKARRVIFFARYEASQYGSPHIETEHLLLGLLREDRALLRFLRGSGDAQSIREEIESHIERRERISTSVEVPLSNECKRILTMAAEEADRLTQKHVGTEHLLLGLLREENCFAAQLLHKRNLSVDQLRHELAVDPSLAAKRADEETVSLSHFIIAWGLGNAGDFARCFAADGQFVDPSGNLCVGPGNIHKAAKLIFAAADWAKCQGRIEDVSFVGPKALMATLAWDSFEATGKPNPGCVRMTVILIQKPDGWAIARVQATGTQPQSRSAAV